MGRYYLQVATIRLLVAELLDKIGHALDRALRTAPQPAVQRPLVVRVVADGVHGLA